MSTLHLHNETGHLQFSVQDDGLTQLSVSGTVIVLEAADRQMLRDWLIDLEGSPVEVRMRLDEREIKQLIRTEIDRNNRALRNALAGQRAA